MEEHCILKGFDSNLDYKLVNSPFLIGRCPTANIVLRNTFMSRNHCQLVHQDGKWHIFDKSTSGTFINDVLLGQGKSAVLSSGDVLRLGPAEEKIKWQFQHILGLNDSFTQSQQHADDIQSQIIVDMYKEKSSLVHKMSSRRAQERKIQLEIRNMENTCADRIKEAQERHAAKRKQMRNESVEAQKEMERRASLETENIARVVEEQKLQLLARLQDNKRAENELREEVERLQRKLAEEEAMFQERLNEMKANLQHELKKKEEDLEARKEELSRAAQQKQLELGEMLSREEAEKLELLQRLETMKKSLEEAAAEKERFEIMEATNALMLQHHEDQIAHLEHSKRKIEHDLKAEQEKQMQHAQNSEEASSSSVKNFEQMLESELQCSLCLEPFITAITLNCTHTFCKFCLEQWKKSQKTCPVCRTYITSENRALAMDNFIDKMVENLSEEFRQRREASIADRRRDEAPVENRGRGRGGGRARGPRRRRSRGSSSAQPHHYNTHTDNLISRLPTAEHTLARLASGSFPHQVILRSSRTRNRHPLKKSFYTRNEHKCSSTSSKTIDSCTFGDQTLEEQLPGQ